MGALDTAVKSGKALYAGISNYDGPTMKLAAELLTDLHCPFVMNQNPYSLLNRGIEKNGLKQAAALEKKGIIAFSPLAQGLLGGRYLNGIPEDSRIRRDGRFLTEKNLTPELSRMLDGLQELAAERGQTLAQLALSWVLKDEDVTSVLIGASKPEQIIENTKIVGHCSFTSEELERIDVLTGESVREE